MMSYVRSCAIPFLLWACASLCACQSERAQAVKALADELSIRNESRLESIRLYDQGIEAYRSSCIDESLRCMNAAVQVDQSNAHAWMALGVLEFDCGNLFEAASAFYRAAELEPTRYEPYYNLGAIYESIGRFDEAIEKYEAALKLRPDQIEVTENLARCYIRKNSEPQKAKKLIDRALRFEQRANWRSWLQQQSRRLGVIKGSKS